MEVPDEVEEFRISRGTPPFSVILITRSLLSGQHSMMLRKYAKSFPRAASVPPESVPLYAKFVGVIERLITRGHGFP